jgi:hypothetical protein
VEANLRNHLVGLAIGFGAGLADCAMFAASGMPITLATAPSALLLWASVGYAIHMVPLPLPKIVGAIAISIFMNAAWMFEFVGNQGMNDLLLPMIGVAVLLGGFMGLASHLIDNRTRRPA